MLRAGCAHQSIVLEAEGHHLMTDVWTTAGVLLGLSLVWLSGKITGRQLLWIDPLMALLIATVLLRLSVKMRVGLFTAVIIAAIAGGQSQPVERATIEIFALN